MKFAV